MHTDAKSLKERGDRLFSQKRVLDARNQEIAWHFYPERADFTAKRSEGEDWADHLMTGYPSMVRRDLGNSLGSMLRPRAKKWFHISVEEEPDHEGKVWLEWATQTQTRAMYDRVTQFARATKEGDHDFAAFGGCVISIEMNWRDTAILYRTWHLRDVAWAQDVYGQISEVYRNWEPTGQQLEQLFGKKGSLHSAVVNSLTQEPHRKWKCRHIKIRSDEYGNKFKAPWASIWIDCENEHIMLEEPAMSRGYVIPLWMTISGSQYPYSPATLIALPDARLIQAMTLTLLEAGERYVNPPMVGVAEAIRGDVQLFAGGFTAVDMEYDERLGEVLRPLNQDKGSFPSGFEMHDRVATLMREAFYLNTMELPPVGGPDMTAYEVGQRVQEYIRRALPLFEPMEHEYNGMLCEETFDLLLRNGGFGPPDSIPKSIAGRDIKFRFESPLADMVEREKGQLFLEAKAMLASAMEVDPEAALTIDFEETLRDVLSGIGVPEKWMASPEAVEAAKQKIAQQAEAQAMMAQVGQGAEAAQKLGSAAKDFRAAGVPSVA